MTKYFGMLPDGKGGFAGLIKAEGDDKSGWKFSHLNSDGTWTEDPSLRDDVEAGQTNSIPVLEIDEATALQAGTAMLGNPQFEL